MPIKRIIAGLSEFHDNYFVAHRELFEQLSHGQSPGVMFITCSDSRIDPCLITQTQPGELFVVRNVGNIIPAYGSMMNSESAAIEYAIQALDIKDIIVCGHSHCGAMKGLLQIGSLSQQMPLVYDWLKHYAEPTRRLVMDNYQNCSGEQLLKIAIQQNVITQLKNLETYPAIRSRIHGGDLTIHAWIYEIETGEVFIYEPNSQEFKLIEQNTANVNDTLVGLHVD